MPALYRLDKFRGGAYLTVLIYMLNNYSLTAVPPALQTIGLYMGMAGFGYVLVILTVKLTGQLALKIISFNSLPVLLSPSFH